MKIKQQTENLRLFSRINVIFFRRAASVWRYAKKHKTHHNQI